MHFKGSSFTRTGKFLALSALLLLVATVSLRCYQIANEFLGSIKPQIEQALGDTLGLNTKIDSLELSFFPKLGLVANGLSLISKASHKYPIKIATVLLRVDYRSLLKRQLKVRTLIVEQVEWKFHQQKTAKTLYLKRFQSNLDYDNNNIIFRLPSLSGNLDKLPFGLKANLIRVDSAGRIVDFSKLIFKSSGTQLQCSGSLHDWLIPGKIQISSGKINLAKLVSRLRGFDLGFSPPYFEQGELTFALNYNGRDKGNTKIDGQASLSNLTNSSKGLKLVKLDLQKLKLSMDNRGSWKLRGHAALQDFIIKDSRDTYQVKHSKGKFLLTQKDNNPLQLEGDLLVDDFAFADDDTKISNVSATISKLVATISAQQDVLVTLQLSGNDLNLVHEKINISGLDGLSAPIRIVVPAQGGYSVSGPVSISKARIFTVGYDFQAVSGQVDMLVSSPLKHFTSNDVSAELQNHKFSLKTDFKMKNDAYILGETSLDIPPAKVSLEGKITRDSERAFSAQVDGQDLKPATLLPLLLNKNESDFQGTVKSLNLDLDGNMNNPVDSLTGNGAVLITEPLSRKFNLTLLVANAISNVPVIGGIIVPDHLMTSDSEQSAKASFTIGQRKIQTADLYVKRDRYTLYGEGSVDFDLNVDGKTSVVFLRETFSGFGGRFNALAKLLGRIGKIEIPLFVEGTFPDLSITPDTPTFLRDNSGLTLLKETLVTTRDVGSKVGDFVSKPFEKKID